MLDREPCEKALEHLNKNRSARKVGKVYGRGGRTTGEVPKAPNAIQYTKQATVYIEVHKSETQTASDTVRLWKIPSSTDISNVRQIWRQGASQRRYAR